VRSENVVSPDKPKFGLSCTIIGRDYRTGLENPPNFDKNPSISTPLGIGFLRFFIGLALAKYSSYKASEIATR
jgi:hypothetical protein